jgi:hypothetical protein
MGQSLVEGPCRTRVHLPVVTSDRGQVTLHSRGVPYTLNLYPVAARALAGELMKHVIFLETEDDRVLGVAPDGSRGDREGPAR